MTTPLSGLHKQVWTAMLAALIAVGAMVQLPIGPVPVTLQTLFIVLAGLILGPVRGASAMALYILAGIIGLPVFAGGKAGFAHMLGPTGGYLLGYVGTALLAGFGSSEADAPPSFIKPLLWSLAGLVCVFAVGLAQLMAVLDISFEKAVAIGFAPFIIGDLIKVFAAVFAYRYLHSRRLLPS
ncbi:biotin transporter BioY [Desulfovibrio subterraneus]|uniref:biotin transporter BioY n=1 Tax=Desulfovibrio subterraneus TaxID=2718620 RepID=UPI0022B92FE1|nr:biotin transporter BioY [Desulfovibrio subterraneus]WBF68799.1 biotin transporter BioY [Desulfovibrio subterraneus]